MNLFDVVRQLHQLDRELTIYARAPWSATSEAAVALEPEHALVPPELSARGLEYFLEVDIARDVVPDLSGPAPVSTLQQWCERLVQYAEHDA